MGGQLVSGQLVSRAGQQAARHSMGTRAGACGVSEGRASIVEGLVGGFC
jgi:hypothetical protein